MRAFLMLLMAVVVVPAHAEQTVIADQLVYRDLDGGGEGSQFNRIMVTSNYVRFDDGANQDGFLLFDRQKKVIYSVNAEDKAILEIEPKPVETTPDDIPKVEVVRKKDDKAPMVGGAKPVEVELLANGESCEKRLLVPGLMKQALAGLAEYHKVLSWQQQATVGTIPAEMQNACDLALNVYYPDLLLKEGLHFQRWGMAGRDELVDFANGKKVDARFFELPKGYRRRAM